jgi:hypothetical protein
MRQLFVVLALWLAVAGSVATAQIQVSAQTQRTNFMLYERVDLLVTVMNIGNTDLILDNNEGHPWLSFLVSKHNRMPVRPERESDFKGLTLKAGENKTLRVNITPLFSFRETGDYKAAAVIDLPGQGQMISEAIPFTIVEGRKVWSQVHSVDDSQRIYSLLRFSPQSDSTQLYLRVEDPAENAVYANVALGDVVASIDPEVFFDPDNNLHVLQPTALGTYLYSRANPDGKVVSQRIFKSVHINASAKIPPRLVKLDDGTVIVAGGLEQDPNHPREKLSDGQSVQKVDAQSAKPDAPATSLQ